MALTADFLEGSIVIALIGYVIAFIFQLYMLYLNYKQSKVNNQMDDLVNEVKAIRKELALSKTTKKTQTNKKIHTK